MDTETRQSNICAVCGTPTHIGCEHKNNPNQPQQEEDLPVRDCSELTEKEKAKNEIMGEIESSFKKILLGSYTVDRDTEGAVAEELFGGPTNIKTVLNDIKIILDLAVSDKWTKEFFIQRLSSIKLRFDSQDLKGRYDDFWPLREEEEPIDDFVDVEKMADKLYNT